MAGTFNSLHDNDVFGNMADDDDDELGFNLDGSGFGADDDDESMKTSSASTSSNPAQADNGDNDLFDDDLPSDSEDADPYADPNDFFNAAADEEEESESAPEPKPEPAPKRRPGRPRKKQEPVAPQKQTDPAPQPAQPDYSAYQQPQSDYPQQQDYNQQYAQPAPSVQDYAQSYAAYQQPAQPDDGMNSYADNGMQQYDPNQYYQQPAQPDYSAYQQLQSDYPQQQDYNQQYAQPASSVQDYAQAYAAYQQPAQPDDGMNSYADNGMQQYDPNQYYQQPAQPDYSAYQQLQSDYPQQQDYNQQYAQPASSVQDYAQAYAAYQQPQSDTSNPFADASNQPAQPDYSAYQQPAQLEQPAAPVQQTTTAPVSQPSASTDSNVGMQSSASTWQSSTPMAPGSVPKPEMIYRIISVTDMIRDNLSGDEKEAVKLVLNMGAIKYDELSEMVYAVLNARKSVMTALQELLQARGMEAATRVFYLIRLDDSDLGIIADIGAKFGSDVIVDKTKKEHYAVTELADKAVSSMPDSSVNLLSAVLNVYNASKEIMNGR